MKNAVKKITAAAMAFTLLGAGTTFAKPISADTNTITASAATVSPNTPHNHGQYTYYAGRVTSEYDTFVKKWDWVTGSWLTSRVHHTDVYDVWKCHACECEAKRVYISQDFYCGPFI